MPTNLRAYAACAAISLAGCAAPLERPVSMQMNATTVATVKVNDLRATEWKTTKILQNSQGVVQHLGDNSLPNGDFAAYLVQRLTPTLERKKAQEVHIKTVDVRLSLPGANVDATQLNSAVAMNGLVAVPVIALLATTSGNKSASAVFCVNVDGKDFLGNDARLFRFGPEDELVDSMEAAVGVLVKNLGSGTETNSVACQPGWEGGQPRK